MLADAATTIMEGEIGARVRDRTDLPSATQGERHVAPRARLHERLPMADVFINYRTDDAGYAAGWLYDRLAEKFGAKQVFRDCRSMHGGDVFTDEIWKALRGSTVLLAVIGRDWLSLMDESGTRRRLDDPADFVRREIKEALKLSIRVIPVLLDGAWPLTAHAVPGDLATVSGLQAVEFRSRSEADLNHLVHDLQRLLPERKSRNSKDKKQKAGGGIQVGGNATFNGLVISGDVNGDVNGFGGPG